MEIPREEDSEQTKRLFRTQPSEIWGCPVKDAENGVVEED